MFNPLHPFDQPFLEAFRRKGVVAFVQQSYPRGKGNETEGADSFILIHFERMLAAQQYFDVIKNDPGRALWKMDNPDDREQICQLLLTRKIFMMLKVKDAEYKARKVLDKRIRAFIEYKLNWRPSRQDDVVFSLDVQFGEVYARLKFRSKEIKVKLEEIENARYVL